MGYFDKYHIFRDSVHGFIKVYDLERDIINSKAFQRLRRIKQLGLTNLIYHGAEHTRFGHSIGVMDVASRIFDTAIAKDKNSDEKLLRKVAKWKEKDDFEKNKIILRLVALLHDIGHCPFSHGSEKLFKNGESHQEMSARIIESKGEISQILDGLKKEYEIDSSIISKIIGNKPVEQINPLINQVLDGPLDADKIDYLWRDSIYTGVYYGRFDLDRLINTMVVSYNRVTGEVALGIEEGGKYVAESLMLARYYMFTQVYFHEIRRAYDYHLHSFIKELLPSGYYPSDTKKFLEFDDKIIYNFLHEYKNQDNSLGKKSRVILNRNHYKVVKETLDSADIKEASDFKHNYEHLKRKFAKVDIFLDSSKEAPNKFHIKTLLLKLKNPPDNKKESKYIDICKKSDVIKQLEGMVINKFRIYAPKEKLGILNKEVRKLNWSN